MNYADIKKVDVANGPGVRVSLFVSGCRNHCKGCFNPETWDFNYGKKWIYVTNTLDILYSLEPDYIRGLSILGGDPMEPENVNTITRLCRTVKKIFPNKTIWIYSGYVYESLKDLEIMEYIDVLVDGPFIESLKDISLKFRGSSNQRIIDIPATRLSGKIKLWEG